MRRRAEIQMPQMQRIRLPDGRVENKKLDNRKRVVKTSGWYFHRYHRRSLLIREIAGRKMPLASNLDRFSATEVIIFAWLGIALMDNPQLNILRNSPASWPGRLNILMFSKWKILPAAPASWSERWTLMANQWVKRWQMPSQKGRKYPVERSQALRLRPEKDLKCAHTRQNLPLYVNAQRDVFRSGDGDAEHHVGESGQHGKAKFGTVAEGHTTGKKK